MKGWVLIVGLLLSQWSLGRTETYFGEARSDGKLVYTEKHTATFDENGRILTAETNYEDPEGNKIGTLKSDFKNSLTLPDHVYYNHIDGSTHGIRTANDKIIMFNQNSGKSEKTKELSKEFAGESLAVGCQGLHYFLVDNLDQVRSKKEWPIKFLIPGTLDYYNFEMEFTKENPDGTVELEIEIDNFLLKIFAPKLIVRYDTKMKRLVWYKGLSNIPTAKGKKQNVEITYKYGS